MDQAFEPSLGIDHHERSDFLGLHQIQRPGGQLAAADGQRPSRHALAGGPIHPIAFGLQEPPQIAVGDNSFQLSSAYHGRQSEALEGHLFDDLRHRRFRSDHGDSIPCMHQLFDAAELAAHLSAGMKLGEIVLAEALAILQDNR